MEKPFRKTGKVMNVPLLKKFCEGGVLGWWETVAERVIQFSQPRPQVLPRRFSPGSPFYINRSTSEEMEFLQFKSDKLTLQNETASFNMQE